MSDMNQAVEKCAGCQDYRLCWKGFSQVGDHACHCLSIPGKGHYLGLLDGKVFLAFQA